MESYASGGRPLKPAASLRDQVEKIIAAAIVSGEMPPGRMYSAPTLAARFGVSATPVREAMLNLEKRGFVEAVRNKGFRVTGVSEQELREIVAVRRMLEPPAMRMLAERFPSDRIGELRAMAEEIVRSARSGELGSYLEADLAFHLRLMEFLGNQRLALIVAELRAQTRMIGLAQMIGTRELDESAAEHHLLLDLLEAGDGEGAESLTARHIGHVLGWWAGRVETGPESEGGPAR